MYRWLMSGGAEVDFAIGLMALLALLCAAILTGYIYGKEEKD